MARLLAELLPLVAWAALMGLGGIWIAQSAFNFRKNEQAMTGLALGIVLQTWLANILAQLIPLVSAIWVAAGIVFVSGLLFSIPRARENPRELFRIPIYPLQWVSLILLSYLFIRVGRGLAILDDLQNLTVTSLIGAGDVPPHFPLDPSRVFGYHYFTMMFAGELMRIGEMFVWTALDVARGLGFAVSLMVGFLWVQRVTFSKVAGVVFVLLSMFNGGTRWLLLLLPNSLVAKISAHVDLIGSGAGTAPDLTAALLNPWAAEGLGPYPTPFAFMNGFNPSSILIYHHGAGGMAAIITGVLLLSHNRWQSWRGLAVMGALIGALALGNEVSFLRLFGGFALIAAISWVLRKKRPPASLLRWFPALAIGGLIAALQGGVLTGILTNFLSQIIPGLGGERAYHTFHFAIIWPPVMLSTHLGSLNLLNPYQLLVALIETGPIILLLPLVVIWGLKAFRSERWYEAAVIILSFTSVFSLFVQYSGTAGPTALTRVQSILVGISSSSFAFAALWMWGRGRSDQIKVAIGFLLLTVMFGGVVIFGTNLIAAPKPVYSTFLNTLDARMTQKYWNRLETDALVYDPYPYRAPVVFGRPNKSSNDWFDRKEEWMALLGNPNPYQLRADGYSYLYIDEPYWDGLSSQGQAQLELPCIELKEEYTQEFPRDFRRLYDLKGCE